MRFGEGGAFVWTPFLAALGGRLGFAIHGQPPWIQAHVHECTSIRRLLRRAEMLQTDVLRRTRIRLGVMIRIFDHVSDSNDEN